MRAHAEARGKLRFDPPLGPEDFTTMIREIRAGRAAFVERQSARVTVHRVTIRDDEIDVVYDKVRGAVVTVLYPDDTDSVWDMLKKGNL